MCERIIDPLVVGGTDRTVEKGKDSPHPRRTNLLIVETFITASSFSTETADP